MAEFKKECLQKVERIAYQLEGMNIEELYEYFEDYLDVKYVINDSGEYWGAYIYIELGGPNVWVDTIDHSVKLAWGGEKVEWGLSRKTVEKIDEIFEECCNSCIKKA